MQSDILQSVGVVMLAAGRGTRIGADTIPKGMYPLAEKPMMEYSIETLEQLGLPQNNLLAVVGYQGEVIKTYFGNRVSYAVQKFRIGTAHAAYCGMTALPAGISTVLVLGCDDSAFYTAKTLVTFITHHLEEKPRLSLLTVDVEDPSQLGRVVRTADGGLERVVEKENVTVIERRIKEVSTGTFVFDRSWFEGMYPEMPIIPKLGEYGLPTTIDIARIQGEPMTVVKLENPDEWFGVNTREQLDEANRRKEVK